MIILKIEKESERVISVGYCDQKNLIIAGLSQAIIRDSEFRDLLGETLDFLSGFEKLEYGDRLEMQQLKILLNEIGVKLP